MGVLTGSVGEVAGRSVAVIGAGIAGLVTAKVLRDDGFDVVVFEREPTVGGVWAESRTYPGLRSNNSRDTYAFSDHPYSSAADRFPTAPQVREYLTSYLERFGLQPLLRLSTEVLGVARRGAASDSGGAVLDSSTGVSDSSTPVSDSSTAVSDSSTAVSGPSAAVSDSRAAVSGSNAAGFEVRTRTGGKDATQHFDFVVVCAGAFSEPQVPEIDGMHRFTGQLLHSSRATDPALFAGKRVVVVGAGKSALDVATWAASHATSTTLLFRKPHWMIPRYLPGGIPSDRLLITRVNESLLGYHRLTRAERFLHGRGKFLTRVMWRVTSRVLRLALGMPAPMVPDKPMPAGIENVGVAPEFYEQARAGRILMRRSTITAFPDGNTLRLSDGDRIDTDVVIFATGWQQSLPFLTPELAALVLRNSNFHLYRNILPPTEPRLGFIGYATSPASQLTSEISAHWLAQLFRNELTLPTPDQMQTEIHRVQSWRSAVLPTQPQGHILGPFLAHHIDELLTDMNLPTRRTTNILTENLAPLYPTRYTGLTDERRLLRPTPPTP